VTETCLQTGRIQIFLWLGFKPAGTRGDGGAKGSNGVAYSIHSQFELWLTKCKLYVITTLSNGVENAYCPGYHSPHYADGCNAWCSPRDPLVSQHPLNIRAFPAQPHRHAQGTPGQPWAHAHVSDSQMPPLRRRSTECGGDWHFLSSAGTQGACPGPPDANTTRIPATSSCRYVG
jgi:hypothetical protein